MAASTSNAVEKPFTLAVPQEEVDYLQAKLALTRLPDELDGAGWAYGAPLADVRRLVARWREGFDWRAAEARINELTMFVRPVEVEGWGALEVHYVHQRSEVSGALPLLFVHGWPGSFLEVRKILPLLTAASVDGEHPSFHVVAVSLPGFGFSEAPKKPGFAGRQYAELFNKLMLSLGYDEYVYQGGDWGHMLGLYTALHYGPKHLKAWHSNVPVSEQPTLWSHPIAYLQSLLPYDTATREGLQKTMLFRARGCGYMVQQATQPQTLGYSLADSPVGLLAWIYEKLVNWSDGYPWSDDEVLEWVSIYWFSRAGPAASIRIYYEMTGGGTKDILSGASGASIPVGLSYFPKETFRLPKSWAHTLGKVVFVGEHRKGGHFAAHEQPWALVADLRAMFGRGRAASGLLSEKDGYAQATEKPGRGP
ncbi:alpha/beta-hydrolase [Trametes polyzona]|nr:alpha/beta-hydrolase [Trametes polyzona]